VSPAELDNPDWATQSGIGRAVFVHRRASSNE
jgi:hypothetical protein